MEITRKSMLTGKVRTMEIEVTEKQIKAWENGDLIQNVMPELSTQEREFIMTGIADNEWELLMDEHDQE